MPYLAVEFPGSGITPFNVWDLDFWWWRIFRARATELAAAQKKQAEQSKKRR